MQILLLGDIMKKCIIFGCGYIGHAAYIKLKRYYEVVAWADNNENLYGKEIYGISVIKPSEIASFEQKGIVDIFVAMLQSADAVKQLRKLSVPNVYIWKGGFFFSADGLFPMEFPKEAGHKKCGDKSLHVLFISDIAGIRDNKMASIVRKAGNKVFLAYIIKPPHDACPEYEGIYERIYPVMSMDSLYEFVKDSEFDIIHCSSEPEYVTPILLGSGKTIIHDCHDLRSSNQSLSPKQIQLEYLAHSGADGVIYPTSGLRDEAIKKFGISEKKTLVVENYPSEDLILSVKKDKLSKIDGEIHCVYEGGITFGDKKCKRYFEEIWMKIVKTGIHIHYYSQCDVKYCKYLESLHPCLHYEGNISSNRLVNELSQYDVGLCIFNNNPKNQLYLESSSPNKLYEYINAGIPVALGDVKSHIQFAESNSFGKQIDLNGDIAAQMKEIASLKIESMVLKKKGFVFENKTSYLLIFYESVSQCAEKGYDSEE